MEEAAVYLQLKLMWFLISQAKISAKESIETILTSKQDQERELVSIVTSALEY